VFPQPAYQKNANVPRGLNPPGFRGRGLPDVTGDGDPASGYQVLVDGESFPVGGTSAVAPLWAALVARINQKLRGQLGFINPQLYALPPAAGALNDITTGNNRCTFKHSNNVGFDAGPGWDACSGLGSPNGVKLAGVLKPAQPAVSAAPKSSHTVRGGTKGRAAGKRRKGR
jgi:kumamolisin